jgi:hypothetical protein
MPLCCSLAVHFRMASELARYSRWGNQRLESRMRENRTYGSEGGEGHTLPDPYRDAMGRAATETASLCGAGKAAILAVLTDTARPCFSTGEHLVSISPMSAQDQNVTRLPITDDAFRGFRFPGVLRVMPMSDGELTRLEVLRDLDRIGSA